MKKRTLNVQELFDSNKIKDELLRYNNSSFNWRSENIPFGELVKVRKDLMVSSLIESRLSGIVALKYTLKSDDEKRLDFVENLLKKIKVNSIVRGAFKAVLFGFTPAIISWETKDGLILPQKIFYRSPRGWRSQSVFDNDGDDELYYTNKRGEIIKASDYEYQIIPIFRNRDDIFPLGEGILEKLFWHTQYKNAGLDFWTKFAEKFGNPYVIADYPEGSEASFIRKLKDLLKNIVGGGWGLVPKGTEIKTFEPVGKGQSSEIFKELLNFCREDISMAILGHTGAAVSTAGKLGGDNTAMTVRDDIALSDSVMIEEFVNALIEIAIEINFGDKLCPSFEFYKEKSNKELAERDKILTDCGAKFKQKYFSKTYSISEDLLEEDTEEVAEFAKGDVADNLEDLFSEFLTKSIFFEKLKGREEK